MRSKKSIIKEQKRQDVIEELIKARKLRRLTQKELAMKIGCPQPTIARIESRSSSPTLDMIERICDALCVDISIIDTKKLK